MEIGKGQASQEVKGDQKVGPGEDIELLWVEEATDVAKSAAEKSGWENVPWEELVRRGSQDHLTPQSSGVPLDRDREHRTLAARVPVPTYAVDDETALKVSGGTVEVVSEGHWRLCTPPIGATER